MKRYFINFDKTINQLVPHYLGGRKLILFLQALMKPLQTLSDAFSEWADETRIEASMTSQVFKLEWFLNRKFRKYFADQSQSIHIKNASKHGVPAYYQNASVPDSDNLLLRTAAEPETDTAKLAFQDENLEQDNTSFTVYSPAVREDMIAKDAYEAMLSYWIDRYRIATKTYKIITNSK